jgi:predicted PhzF superfamily epimerase YddE/YHI9
LGRYVHEFGALAPYVAAQGSRLGRAGRVHVSESGGDIWIGGRVAIVVSGRVTL